MTMTPKPEIVGTFGAWGGVTVPIGTPIPWLLENLPPDTIAFEGDTFTKEEAPKLFELYGGKMPDLRGYFLRALDQTGTRDGEGKTRKVGDFQEGTPAPWAASNGVGAFTSTPMPNCDPSNRTSCVATTSWDWGACGYAVPVSRPKNIAVRYITPKI